jgi:hypothetical protein
MLLQHIRTGDRTMFDVASDMASHRYDIDRGFWGWQHYEKGHHGHRARIVRKRYRSGFKPHASHTWCRGLFLYWVLTGDPRAYEAAELNATAYSKILDRQKDKPVVPMREFRVPAWGIEACLAMYEYKGDKHYLEKANDIFTRTLLGMEKENGSKGHIIKDGRQSAQFTSYAIEPVVRLINVTGRKDAADFLKRVLAWQRKNGVIGGTMKRDKYQPLMMKRHSGILADIDEEIQEASASLAYNLLFADGYAYLFGLFRTEKDMEFARDLYRDAMFYYGIPGTRVDPSARTPLGYHFRGRVDNMCAKVQAFMSRYGQVYMLVEDKLTRPAEAP